MKKIILLLPLLFLLTGCYNYRELNDLAIVSGISIHNEGNEYQVTVEVVNPKKDQDASSGKEPDYIIYKSSGDSMQEALRKVIKESPKKLYSAHMSIMIIDEETAKNGLTNILDFFSRDPETRSEFYVLIGKTDDILEVTTPLENISSKNILDSLKANNSYLGFANLVTYHDVINHYLNKKIELVLPSLEIKGNVEEGKTTENIETTESDATSVISTEAIFKEDKLLGYLTEEESLAYNLIMNNAKSSLIQVHYQEDEFIVNEIIKSSSSVKIDSNAKKVTISLTGKASIKEINAKYNLENDKVIKKIEKDLNQTINHLIQTSIQNIIKNYNTDIFGFQDIFYKSNPKKYKEIKDSWYQEIFPNLEIEVKSNIRIIEKGNLNGGIYYD